jgi:hypothetical protein
MKVKLISTMASAKGTAQAGQIVDLPDDEAVGLIKAGYAVVEKSVALETAELVPDETAALPVQETAAQKTAEKPAKPKKAKA